jgi:hypothetical protein
VTSLGANNVHFHGTPYTDLGVDYFDRRHAERLKRRCIRQLERLGLQVTLSPAPAAA